MALPTGTFSHPDAGRLRVAFSGKWLVDGAEPAFRYGSWDLVLRAYVGSGATRRTAILGIGTNTAVIDLEYAGGYAEVPVGMEYVSHTFDGSGVVAATYLSVSCNFVGV